MKSLIKLSLACGIALMLAAFPVFAQEAKKPVSAGELTRKPLLDFVEIVKQKFEKKEIDFDKLFLVEIEGILTDDGRLDAKKTKVIKSEGDAQMIEVAKSAVLALSDSGLLLYLNNVEIEKISFVISQDESRFYASIISESKTVKWASTISSFFNYFVLTGKSKAKEEDEKLLLSNIKASHEGKKIILNCSLPKTTAQEMIKRNLLKYTNRKSESAAK